MNALVPPHDRGEFRVSFDLTPAAIAAGMEVIQNEPVIIENSPVQTTEQPQIIPLQNQPAYKLDAFDILSRATAEISSIAAQCGIDWQALSVLLNRNQTEYKDNAIALDKTYKGAVKAWLDIKTTKISGQEYPVLTFNSLKQGGLTERFNGYEWLKDNRFLNFKPPTESDKQAIQAKRAEQEKQQAARAELVAQDQAREIAQKTVRFNQFSADFARFPRLTATEFKQSYLAAKNFTFESIPAEFIIKRGFDKRGGFIVYPLKNVSFQIVGYQKIYDLPFIDGNGNQRNKDFVFLPSAKNGSFATLSHTGKINKAENIYLCEGLATALTVYVASGSPVAICLDAGNLVHVATALNVNFKNITIAADNDIIPNSDKNTGIDKANEAAAAVNAAVIFPNMGGVKCDFNDLMIAKGIEEVKRQLTGQLFSGTQIIENKQQEPAARGIKELGNILLSTIKLYFCQKQRLTESIKLSVLATKSGLSLEEVVSVIDYLVADKLCQYQDNYLTELNDLAFTCFNVKNIKQSKQVIRESLKAEYQNSEKLRKPRNRVKNNPELIKDNGNRCGHSVDVLPVFKLPENSKKRPPVIALMFKKISNYFGNPKGVLPKLNNARNKRTKKGVHRQQRSERREACILLLGAILSRLDLLTMRVGCPIENEEFTGIRLSKLAEIAGISFTRAEKASHDLVKSGLVGVVQRCEKLADGTYKGYAAIRLVSTELFKAFNLLEELKEAREKLAKRAAKKLKGVMPLSMKELIQTAADKQAALVASGLTPVAAFMADLRGTALAKN